MSEQQRVNEWFKLGLRIDEMEVLMAIKNE